MPAKIIAVENTKGGTGKSTITINLACRLMLQGNKVLIVDRDTLRITRKWREVSTREDYPIVVGIDTPTIHRDLKQVSDNFDYILIDGSAIVETMSESAIRAADLVLIPILHSGADVWGTEPLIKLIKMRQSVTDGLPICRVIINKNKKNTRLSKNIHGLVESYDLSMLKVRISDSAMYTECIGNGISISDFKTKRALPLIEEFNQLIIELKELIA